MNKAQRMRERRPETRFGVVCTLCPFLASVVAMVSFLGLARHASPSEASRCRIVVVDTSGNPITHYDLYIYHCKGAGSRLSHAFFFPDQPKSEFVVPGNVIHTSDIARVSPNLGVLTDYWVAGVNKHGYRSRRWGIPAVQSNPVKIVLSKASDPGEDYCDGKKGECDACRSHEYSMYGETMRYRTLDCAHGRRH